MNKSQQKIQELEKGLKFWKNMCWFMDVICIVWIVFFFYAINEKNNIEEAWITVNQFLLEANQALLEHYNITADEAALIYFDWKANQTREELINNDE